MLFRSDFLQKLEDRGVSTPVRTQELKPAEWKELHALRRLEVFIAPPILANDEVEVARLLHQSRKEVEKAVDDLKRIVSSSALDY